MQKPTEFMNDKPVPGACAGEWFASGKPLRSTSPVDGALIAEVTTASAAETEKVIAAAHAAFLEWRQVPAPVRAEVVRKLGIALREHKEELAQLVTLAQLITWRSSSWWRGPRLAARTHVGRSA